MKKQISILALTLALIAGTSVAFGQAIHVSDPEAPVSCTNDALHPIAGVPYTYTVTTEPTAPGGTYTWWATTNQAFITAGVPQNIAANVLVSPNVVATTAANYNNTANTSNTIQLTWGTDIIAAAMGAGTPTFVAVHYNAPAGGCTDNLKVYEIDPINAFIVDIKNVENATLASLDYKEAEAQCFDKVQSASWSTSGMTYDFGTNVLVFEVVAANFSGSWTPTFTLSALGTGQIATMVWDYSTAFTAPVTVTSGVASGTDVNTSVSNTSNGVSIFVRVTIANNAFEGINDEDITLSVTGTNTANQRDVLATDCNTPATLASNSATQTLNERPEIINGTTGGTFE